MTTKPTTPVAEDKVEEVTSVQEPAVTEKSQSAEQPAQADTATGVVVESSAAPAGVEAKPEVIAAIAKETTTAAPKLSGFEKKISDVLAKGSAREIGLVNFMTTYLTEMAPGKPVDEKTGSQYQAQFIRQFLTITKFDDNFKECMDLLIGYFNQHKEGALHERYVFRFTEYMTLSPDMIFAFRAMVNLMIVAASSNKREVMKQVDLNRSLNSVYTEDARQRVIGYFS